MSAERNVIDRPNTLSELLEKARLIAENRNTVESLTETLYSCFFKICKGNSVAPDEFVRSSVVHKEKSSQATISAWSFFSQIMDTIDVSNS